MRRIILTAAVALIVTQIASMVFNNDIHQGGYCDPIARWIVEGALPKAAVAQEPGPGIITTFAGVGSFSGDGRTCYRGKAEITDRRNRRCG